MDDVELPLIKQRVMREGSELMKSGLESANEDNVDIQESTESSDGGTLSKKLELSNGRYPLLMP